MRWFVFVCLLGLFGCDAGTPPLTVIRGQTMGTTFQVKIPKTGLDSAKLNAEINALLVEVNRQMSTYQSDSEISQFNQAQTTDWVGISKDFGYVLGVAQQISRWSDGAFDVTVGPLVNLWGFGPEAVPERVPPADSIAAKQAVTGYARLEIQKDPPAVRKQVPLMYCDLSAVAKGFGVDAIAMYLDGLGMDAYFVEIGGEVRVKGLNAQGVKWRVGISTPTVSGGLQKVVPLENQAIATSGDYHNFFEKDGKRYSHTIDPRTGYPIAHTLASVSVIHDECAFADGLATAINVMGPEKGLAFAIERNLAIFMIVKGESGFEEVTSPAFDMILENAN